MEENKRVFIVGSPRSGTTILQSVIASHPKIRSFPETHFFSTLIPKSRLKRMLGVASSDVNKQLKQVCEDNFIANPELVIPRQIIPLIKDSVEVYIQLLDSLALQAGKSIWVEKTPIHLHFIDTIQRFVSDVSFIHIVRNGLDVVDSMKAIQKSGYWGTNRSLEQLINRWIDDISISRQYQNYSNHLIIRYEQLLEAPEFILQKVASFLSIQNNFDLKGSDQNIIAENEIWKKSVKAGLKRNYRKGTTTLNPQEKKIVDQLTSDVCLANFNLF